MHIVFERSNGHIRSNCNILALAWMPYYNESAFRRSHLSYQQRLLAHLTEPFGYQLPLEPPNEPNSANENINRRGLQEILRRQPEIDNIRPGGRNSNLDQLIKARAINNSRLIEQVQRFVHTNQRGARQLNDCDLNDVSNAAINDRIDELYGKTDSFGWLAIGNIGKMVGVTLTSIVEPPIEVDGRKSSANDANNMDLIDLNESTIEPNGGQKEQTQIRAEPMRPDRRSARTNYNLRGHLDEVILVKWNEIYQKLASVDSKGNVLIWSKSSDKFTIQTPFYNKSKSVADFKWSNDGKTALICYTDSFILVGSSFSQRHWHSMLNLEDYHITCATWTPNDEQLLLGVSNGNIILIDLPTSELTELAVGQANIRAMCWSSSELNLRHLDLPQNPPSPLGDQRDARLESASSNDLGYARSDSRRQQQNVVNRRRLSLNCALFCRHRHPGSLNDPSDRNSGGRPRRPASATRHQQVSIADNRSSNHSEILAIDFTDNTIKLFNGGLNDPKPRRIQVQLESYLMAWSSDGRTLAVGGFNIYTSAPSVGCLRCKYLNTIKFYNQEGQLVHERRINFTRYPITALTWAHEDRRLFVATGPRLHCAKVFMGVPRLSLLSMSRLYRNTKLMDKSDALMNLVGRHFVPSLLNWQSYNCPIEIDPNLDKNLQRQSNLLPVSAGSNQDEGKCVGGATGVGCSDQQQAHLMNNVNVTNFQLPAKLKSKIDQLFSQTMCQPYDEQFTLGDIAWHVPKNQQRLHCTLVCYTHELLDAAGCLGHQYKVQDFLQTSGATSQQRSKSSGGASIEADLQFKIFVLYVEFQGSLVPILKARRIGFLKPEFVLFDPEPKFNGSLQRYYKVSDIYQNSDNKRNLQSNPCAELHGANYMGNLSPFLTRRQPLASQARDSATRFDAGPRRITRDPHLLYLLNLSQQRQQRSNSSRDKQSTTSNETAQTHPALMRAIERQRMRSLRAKLSGSASGQSQSLSGGQSGLRSLPETSELIRIKSNIWGTKFKLINMSNQMTDRRAVLGSVRYKASLLHLQPRQIHLSMKDMSNYCVLCSVHHHTKLRPQKRTQAMALARNTTEARTTGGIANSTPMSLIDLPLASPNHLQQSSPGRPSRRRHKSTRETHVQSGESEKLVLAVGDTIRVAPQLEPNQRYKLEDRSSSSVSRSSRHRSLFTQSPTQVPASVQSHNQRHGNSSETKQAIKRLNRAANSQSTSSRTAQADDGSEQFEPARVDDVLTMSIDQCDHVQLEMSSKSSLELECSQVASSKPARSNVGEQKIEDFLRANKTLKSIQTITNMIVDLSAKAQEDVDMDHAEAKVEPHSQLSPVKLLRIEDTSGVSHRSPSRYIPPETPVHRPRGRATQSKRTLPAHSATNSPLESRRSRLETRNLLTSRSLNPDDPLPPPPPSVPFRRRLSISAKRFIDGSLRSLSSLGVSGNYLTGDEADTEECEVLVQPRQQHRLNDKRGRSANNQLANRHQSQPCTPLRSSLIPARQPNIDLASLRSQVVEKLRLSSSWMSPARSPKESLARRSSRSSARQRHDRPASCTKRSNLILKEPRDETLPTSSIGTRSQSLLASSNSSSSSDLSRSSSSSSYNSSSSSSNEDDPGQMADGDFSFLNQATRTKLFKKTSRLSSSVKEFGRLDNRSNSRNSEDRRQHSKPPRDARKRTRSRRVRNPGGRSICSSSSCCCGREFKLSNRSPVWNELSQVYQLDFGGRVTQESAKNLQIDFNGNLALQFGRIDKCTYTLDYQFPFNAVQAMSIALASLTQRLK